MQKQQDTIANSSLLFLSVDETGLKEFIRVSGTKGESRIKMMAKLVSARLPRMQSGMKRNK